MHVLLIMSDLYNSMGGGQTVARQIIEQNLDISFTYFRVDEPIDIARPNNCHTVPLLQRLNLKPATPPPHTAYEWQAIEEANAIARSVAGKSFDIVEIPDFKNFGFALPAACAYHNVKVGRFVLALHGNLSHSVELNWGSAGDCTLEMKILERRQFVQADGVYGISERYIKEWQSRIPRDVTYIDPLHFVFAKTDLSAWIPSGKPSLYCIGRSERLKGNDLFIELSRWQNRDSFEKIAHIGAGNLSNGIQSDYHLQNIASIRGLDIPHLLPFSHSELGELYKTPAIVILPTRYDTLNLVALEAVFSGCPIAVSTRSGVCDYLDKNYPGLPYCKIDLDDFYSNLRPLSDLIENYDRHRSALHQYIIEHRIKSDRLDMRRIYHGFLSQPKQIDIQASSPPNRDARHATRKPSSQALYHEDHVSIKRRILHFARQFTPNQIKNRLRPLWDAPRETTIRVLRDTGFFGDAQYFSTLIDSQWVPGRLRSIGAQAEPSQNGLKNKLGSLYAAASNPLQRCNFWSDIARIERLRGEDLMAATYELRILRLLGADQAGLLPHLTRTLEENGFTAEADAARALYANPEQAADRVYRNLKQRYDELRHYQEKAWAFIDDRRHNSPKVSVIVSLYKAEDKLRTFSMALSQQTLLKEGQVEIILVDSASPTDEKGVFEAFHNDHPIDMVYARSAQRETIQAAWNRGIILSRAPYLVFLGADETIYPETLALLADELDAQPDIDWVMGHSLVTAVDDTGLYKNDIMAYHRQGGTKDHVYLETCYLSWVGGMYRRSIHERFGYYDETFRGAGDTEFKNRILPHINIKFIDRMLGVFLNYPDGQTTASPMAEIEDSRAWYLFRTAGGVRYALENRPIEDAENILLLCLGYRKSYCRHISTDIEYGALVADYILTRDPANQLAGALAPGLHQLLATLRAIEYAQVPTSRLEALQIMIRAWRTARTIQRQHNIILESHAKSGIAYQLLNDNRYEQHSWLWRSI